MEKLENYVTIDDLYAVRRGETKYYGYSYGERSFVFFKGNSGRDVSFRSDETLFDEAFGLGKLVSEMDDFTEVFMTTIIRKGSSPVKRRETDPMSEIYDVYDEEFLNGRTAETFMGMETSSLGKKGEKFLESVGAEPMRGDEFVSLLHSAFNPGVYFPGSATARRVVESESVVDALAASQIKDEESGVVRIGDRFVKTYEMTFPPSDVRSFRISKLLEDLTSQTENEEIWISVAVMVNSGLLSKLDSKIKRAKTAAFSLFSNDNGTISENAEKTISFCENNNVKPVLLAVSFSVVFDSEEKARKWSFENASAPGAAYSPEIYDPVYAWFRHIPGQRRDWINAAIVPAPFAAEALLYHDPSSAGESFAADKIGLTTSVPFFDDRRFVDSLLVSARTGRGKSVLLNRGYAEFFHKFHPKCESFVVDYGGSYLNFMERYNSRVSERERMGYVNPSSSSGQKLNPFDLVYGESVSENSVAAKLKILAAFFSISLGGLTDEEEILLYDSLRKTYERILLDDEYKKTDSEGKVYLDEYERSGSWDAFRLAMPTVADVIPVMSSDDEIRGSHPREVMNSLAGKISVFIRSPFTEIFSEPSTSPITSKHLVLDLKPAMSEDPSMKLAGMLFLYYSGMFFSKMMREEKRDIKKLIIFDEYPRLLSAFPKIEDYLDMLLKTGRKENAAVWAVSQNVTTFRKDFVENTGAIVVFSPASRSETKNLAEFCGKDFDYVKIVESLETLKGKYSEFAFIETERDMAMKAFRVALEKELKPIFTVGG